MNITPEQKTQIEELKTHNDIESDLVYIIEEATDEDATDIDTISDYIDEQTNGFMVEIIYYNRAMEYLSENDPGLQYSLGIANDMGFTLDKLNSETLASLLASENERENYEKIKDELSEILFPTSDDTENNK